MTKAPNMGGVFARMKSSFAPSVYYNTGTTVDIANGRFIPGMAGSSILDGGFNGVTAVYGKPETYKSGTMLSYMANILANYPDAQAMIWENENSVQDATRFDDLCDNLTMVSDRIAFMNLKNLGYLEDFDDMLTELINERIKMKNDLLMETPFKGIDGKPIMQMRPMLVGVDSMSAAYSRQVFKEFGKKDLDDPKNQRMYMVEGGIKTRFYMQLPKRVAEAGITFFSTGHAKKDKGAMADPMSKFDTPATPNMLKDSDINRVGSQYLFLSNNCVETRRVKTMLNDKKLPIYGTPGMTRADLRKLNAVLVKGKSNQGSGMEIPHTISGRYGINRNVEATNYLRENHAAIIGTSGNKTDPLTQLKYTNNSFREKASADHTLARSTQLLGQFAYLRDIWVDHKRPLPSIGEFADMLAECNQTLRDDIVNSTGVWEFKDSQAHSGRKYISVIDVVDMLVADKK